MGPQRFFAASLLAALPMQVALAQGIYTCVDAKGRKLTADRPIIDCIDREQREISPQGQVVRRIGPSMTAEERAAEEERQRKLVEERNRQLEEKRRERALLARYPDPASHEKERASAIATIDEVIATATRRTAELVRQQKGFAVELEFHKNDINKAPPHVKRQIDDLEGQIAGQKRFIADQEAEKKRVNARYDEEFAKLKQLWAMHQAVPVAVKASAAASRR